MSRNLPIGPWMPTRCWAARGAGLQEAHQAGMPSTANEEGELFVSLPFYRAADDVMPFLHSFSANSIAPVGWMIPAWCRATQEWVNTSTASLKRGTMAATGALSAQMPGYEILFCDSNRKGNFAESSDVLSLVCPEECRAVRCWWYDGSSWKESGQTMSGRTLGLTTGGFGVWRTTWSMAITSITDTYSGIFQLKFPNAIGISTIWLDAAIGDISNLLDDQGTSLSPLYYNPAILSGSLTVTLLTSGNIDDYDVQVQGATISSASAVSEWVCGGYGAVAGQAASTDQRAVLSRSLPGSGVYPQTQWQRRTNDTWPNPPHDEEVAEIRSQHALPPYQVFRDDITGKHWRVIYRKRDDNGPGHPYICTKPRLSREFVCKKLEHLQNGYRTTVLDSELPPGASEISPIANDTAGLSPSVWQQGSGGAIKSALIVGGGEASAGTQALRYTDFVSGLVSYVYEFRMSYAMTTPSS